MKSAPFQYVRPQSLAEACAALASDDDARVIAGGQTLVPMLAMRLARPSLLVDVARIPELSGIRDEGDAVVIGAVTRQVMVERSDLVKEKLPLLAEAMPWIGHPPTRSRGTVGGSIANADPSAEIPLVAVVLDAEITVATVDQEEIFIGEEFFIGPMLTAIPEYGCLTQVKFPVWTKGAVGASFHEISARSSDFAFASAAAQVALDDDGRCIAVSLGIGGVGDHPEKLAADALVGTIPSDADLKDVVRAAMEGVESIDDLHATAAYRLRVAETFAYRALADSIRKATAKLEGANK